MNVRAALPVRFGSADDLPGNRRDFSDTEEQEANEVRRRIAFRPFEVDVRQAVGLVSHREQ